MCEISVNDFVRVCQGGEVLIVGELVNFDGSDEVYRIYEAGNRKRLWYVGSYGEYLDGVAGRYAGEVLFEEPEPEPEMGNCWESYFCDWRGW